MQATPPQPSRRLACAVIEAAWIEYLGFDRRASDRAREWFLSAASNFAGWCELAGLADGTAQRIRRKLLDTSPLWLESAQAQAMGLPEPSQQTPTRQRVHAVASNRGRPRKGQSQMKRLLLLLILLPAALAAQTRNVALAWTDSQAAVTFNVYRAAGACPAAPAQFAKINAAPVTAKTYTDPDIAPGTYCYHVTANASGLESDPSNNAEAQARPFSPGGLTVVVEVAITVKPSGEVVARMDVKKSEPGNFVGVGRAESARALHD